MAGANTCGGESLPERCVSCTCSQVGYFSKVRQKTKHRHSLVLGCGSVKVKWWSLRSGKGSEGDKQLEISESLWIVGTVLGLATQEKNCQEEYNLACILTLPAYQRKV